MLLLPQNKSTPLHNAAAMGQHEAVQLLLTAKADADAANNVSDSPRSVMELRRVLSCAVDWGHRTSGPHYTVLLRMDTMRQCSYCSLRRPMLMLRTTSVTCPL